MQSLQTQLKTVMVLTKLSTRRFFRDKLALFFGILFPLIFLGIFGAISKSNNLSFQVALINDSSTVFAKQFTDQLSKNKVFKIDQQAKTMPEAKEKLIRSQIDGIIVLPQDFGKADSKGLPSGKLELTYNQTSSGTGETLVSVLNGMFKGMNSRFVTVSEPFTVQSNKLSQRSLSSFDYAFAGLLGFSIIGMGIFGPVNVFPELKKQGILRRLHTTPLRVWQYFLATMFSQAITGLVSIAIMFVFAILVFDLNVVGNYLEVLIFTVLSIFLILGIGLAIGGWAKNERQAAPLSNIVVFPMLFLSGTFFPRYAMPQWLQGVTDYLPLTPVIDGLRLITTEGKHLLDLGPQLLVMGVWFVVVYAIAFRVFRWE